jgi:putative ABC transport system permease protein
MLFHLALRNLLRHRVRTGMTLAAIVFGVTGLVLSGGFVRDILVQLGEALIHSQTGHLQVFTRGYYDYGTRSPEKFLIQDPTRLATQINALPGIDDVMARVAFAGLVSNGRADWAIVGEGVEPNKEARLGSYLRVVSGQALRDDMPNGIMIGQGVADALKLAPGDRVTLLVNTYDGALNSEDVEVVGVFQSFSKEFDARAVRVPLKLAQQVLGSRGVTSIVVSLKQTKDTESTLAAIAWKLEGSNLEVRSWVQLNDFYEKTVALYERQFGVLQLIVVAMVLLSVANTVNMSVFERTGEFGTMRALGNRGIDVTRLVLVENALLGVIGGVLGVIVGALLAIAISAIGIPMPPPPNANLSYTAHILIVPSVLLASFLVGFVATALASLLPAFRVAGTPVVDALRANV